MQPLMERVGYFAQKKPAPVQRNGQSYDATYRFVSRLLRTMIFVYRRLAVEDQTARLVRDVMDFALRRYHGYCIKENIGAHYVQKGLSAKAKTEFEHVIPASLARDLLLHGRLTVDEALNIPTCKLSKSNHAKLGQQKLTSTTPDIYWFWKRYDALGIEVKTHDGTAVDMKSWNLDTHYKYFQP